MNNIPEYLQIKGRTIIFLTGGGVPDLVKKIVCR